MKIETNETEIVIRIRNDKTLTKLEKNILKLIKSKEIERRNKEV